jgi:quinol monooxygenase YgiN
MENMMFIIAFKFCAKPAKLSEITQSLKGIKDKVIGIDGCLDAQIYQNIDEKKIFFFVEEWENKKCLEEHKKTKLFAALRGLGTLMVDVLEITHIVEK